MKKIEDNNTLVFIVDVRSNKRQISQVSARRMEQEASRLCVLGQILEQLLHLSLLVITCSCVHDVGVVCTSE
jgi:hypothetical protein